MSPVGPTPAVWRCLDEIDGLAVARIHQVVPGKAAGGLLRGSGVFS